MASMPIYSDPAASCWMTAPGEGKGKGRSKGDRSSRREDDHEAHGFSLLETFGATFDEGWMRDDVNLCD